jgi:hypothetical protein
MVQGEQQVFPKLGNTAHFHIVSSPTKMRSTLPLNFYKNLKPGAEVVLQPLLSMINTSQINVNVLNLIQRSFLL